MTNFTNNNISSIKLNGIAYNLKSIPFHGTEDEWTAEPQANYIPKQGEIIVYDVDNNYNYERMKIGDGATNVTNLPFIGGAQISIITWEEND